MGDALEGAPPASEADRPVAEPPSPTPSTVRAAGGLRRRLKALDTAFGAFSFLAGAALVALPVLLVIVIGQDAWPAIVRFGFGFFVAQTWDPNLPPITFGSVAPVAGTLETSALAMLIGVPLSVGGAVFLAELAPAWLRGSVAAVVDLLAAVPSVVFGLWGLYVLVPLMRTSVDPTLAKYLAWTGLVNDHAGSSSGLGLLTAGVILAIMILPTISSVSREALRTTPDSQREAALSLGATKWEATRLGPLAYARSGIFGAAILGLGRAMGETMAIVMTFGNAIRVPHSLFDPGQTLSGLIAVDFGNALPLERAALVELGLILMALSLLVNVVARLMLRSMERVGRSSG